MGSSPPHSENSNSPQGTMRVMTRRELLAAAGAACASPVFARTHFDKSRISAITDEIGKTTDESIAFAHQYGLTNVEIRNPPGVRKEYYQLSEAEIKSDALRFQKQGLKVSFVNTGMLKFAWPGTEPARKRSEEHTSELQSPYVISYAVFCLKKKKKQQAPHPARTPDTCPRPPSTLDSA